MHIRPKGASSLEAMKGKASKKAIKDLQIGDEVLAFAGWKEKGASQRDTADKLDQRLSYEKVTDLATSYKELQD